MNSRASPYNGSSYTLRLFCSICFFFSLLKKTIRSLSKKFNFGRLRMQSKEEWTQQLGTNSFSFPLSRLNELLQKSGGRTSGSNLCYQLKGSWRWFGYKGERRLVRDLTNISSIVWTQKRHFRRKALFRNSNHFQRKSAMQFSRR